MMARLNVKYAVASSIFRSSGFGTFQVKKKRDLNTTVMDKGDRSKSRIGCI